MWEGVNADEDEGSEEGNEKQMGDGDSEQEDGEEDEVWVNEEGTGGVQGGV